jgi:hypothetical protein
MAQTMKFGAVVILVLVAAVPLAAQEFSFDNLRTSRSLDRLLFTTAQDRSIPPPRPQNASVGMWMYPPFFRFVQNANGYGTYVFGVGAEGAWLVSPAIGLRLTVAWHHFPDAKGDGDGINGMTVTTAFCWRFARWPSGATYFDIGASYGLFSRGDAPATSSLGMELIFGTEVGARHRRGRAFFEFGVAVLNDLRSGSRFLQQDSEFSEHSGVHVTLFRFGVRFYL